VAGVGGDESFYSVGASEKIIQFWHQRVKKKRIIGKKLWWVAVLFGDGLRCYWEEYDINFVLSSFKIVFIKLITWAFVSLTS